jgi:hypothetical protein
MREREGKREQKNRKNRNEKHIVVKHFVTSSETKKKLKKQLPWCLLSF